MELRGLRDERRAERFNQPKLLIASRVFGASGQPWLWRQVAGLRGFRKDLLCWERRNTERRPEGVSVHVLPEDPAPYDGAGRWWYRFRNLPGRNFYAAVGQERRQLAEFMRREQPAVVLCYFGDIAMRLLPVAKQEGVPVVAYLHGDFQFVNNRWYRWSLRRCLRQFAAIAVVTNAERRWVLENGMPAGRVHVIPCGAPTDKFRFGVVARRLDGTVRFTMASRLVAEKGCDVSIEAFARLAPDLIGTELHIYGDGPDRDELERLVEARGLKAQVWFHGYVDEQQLAEKLPSYDVFIQHSLRKEGSPVSIIEAMACGLPVVATPVGGIPAQVLDGKTGFLVAERDVHGMEMAMRTLALDAQLRRALGDAGRERALKLYDATVLTRCLERVLLNIVGARPNARSSSSEWDLSPADPVSST